jgi:hypothetical protein
VIRWIRIGAAAVAILALVAVGAGVGLFLVENNRWVAVAVPPWLRDHVGGLDLEIWFPAALAGWVIGGVSLLVLGAWTFYYLWRRRQYESLVRRLERELADLRNLPFTHPAPLEDLPASSGAASGADMGDPDELDLLVGDEGDDDDGRYRE